MKQQVAQSESFSDLLQFDAAGQPRLCDGVHPIPELLQLEAEEILRRFKVDQEADFEQVIGALSDRDDPLRGLFASMQALARERDIAAFNDLPILREGALKSLFIDLHEHVMEHPVWRHPFFLRLFRGEFTRQHLTRFALNYFNQVKNTRQCVALALGRFSGVMANPYGQLNERVSELTQIVLAQLIADEYGVGSHSIEEYPTLAGLFSSTTHIVMYRKLFEGLDVPFVEQDVPMLHGVADNVLTQRIVAGDPRFSQLEALASVGLGMEWGVPEFFSLILGGLIRFAWKSQISLTRDHLDVFIAHVRYDVLHAISVMLVTGFYLRDTDDVAHIKNATNLLMSARYGMMSDLYRYVFDEACPTVQEIDLDSRYQIGDRRIEGALREARAAVADGTVVECEHYRDSTEMPFVFRDNAV